MTQPPSINLMPAGLIRATRRRCACRVWIAVLGVCLSISSVVVSAARSMDETGLAALLESRREADENLAAVRDVITDRQADLDRERIAAQLRARLVDRPDWSRLMSLLGRVLDGRGVLRTVSLEPLSIDDTPRFVGETPYTLVLNGEASTTKRVSEIVVALVDCGVFDEVELVRTSRDERGGTTSYLFEVRCGLGTEGGTP